MLPPVDCFNGEPVAIQASITLQGADQASLKWTFTASAALPPKVTLAPNGDLDLRALDKPVLLTLTLDDPTRQFWSGSGVDVFGYARDGDYTHMKPLPPGNQEMKVVSYSPKVVTVCYRNRARPPGDPAAPHSRYTIYLGDGGPTWLPYWIDPIISNGGNPK
ncbi:MAG TPA: hypothetical protein VG939_22815 [Caulobacteraceae bacterium]|nr:hypothetical protein [Caulobacteraceae bacterium]